MHELSIVMGIIKIAETETRKAAANKVDIIELDIGTLAGIEIDAFDFAWSRAVTDTVLEHAVKKVNVIEAKGQCLECDKTFSLKEVFDPCPYCNNYVKGILQGKELRVKALEVT